MLKEELLNQAKSKQLTDNWIQVGRKYYFSTDKINFEFKYRTITVPLGFYTFITKRIYKDK